MNGGLRAGFNFEEVNSEGYLGARRSRRCGARVMLLEYPVAHADPNDDAHIYFLQRAVGVTGPSNDLIALGHAICDANSGGSPAHTDPKVLSRAAQLGLTQHQLTE